MSSPVYFMIDSCVLFDRLGHVSLRSIVYSNQVEQKVFFCVSEQWGLSPVAKDFLGGCSDPKLGSYDSNLIIDASHLGGIGEVLGNLRDTRSGGGLGKG